MYIFYRREKFYKKKILPLMEFCPKGVNRKLNFNCGYICIYASMWRVVFELNFNQPTNPDRTKFYGESGSRGSLRIFKDHLLQRNLFPLHKNLHGCKIRLRFHLSIHHIH